MTDDLCDTGHKLIPNYPKVFAEWSRTEKLVLVLPGLDVYWRKSSYTPGYIVYIYHNENGSDWVPIYTTNWEADIKAAHLRLGDAVDAVVAALRMKGLELP